MTLDWSIVWLNKESLAEGALMTIVLTVLTMGLAVPLGIVLAFMRLSKWRSLALLSQCFVELFRNIPLILIVYWSFYVIPILIPVQFSAFTTGLVALVLCVSAYNAETFRAGINSVRHGQTNAGLALGMSQFQVMKEIILPQAARRVLPILATTWVSLFKDTSLVSVIAVGELSHVALQIRSQSFRVLEMLTAMAVIYWMMGYPQAKLSDWIRKKFEVKE